MSSLPPHYGGALGLGFGTPVVFFNFLTKPKKKGGLADDLALDVLFLPRETAQLLGHLKGFGRVDLGILKLVGDGIDALYHRVYVYALDHLMIRLNLPI